MKKTFTVSSVNQACMLSAHQPQISIDRIEFLPPLSSEYCAVYSPSPSFSFEVAEFSITSFLFSKGMHSPYELKIKLRSLANVPGNNKSQLGVKMAVYSRHELITENKKQRPMTTIKHCRAHRTLQLETFIFPKSTTRLFVPVVLILRASSLLLS